jgi:carbonic anhydrase/acetyltransferase-like protein (isoleucine patch superfamily)
MGAIVLDGAEVGEECLIAAGAVVGPRAQIPPRSLVVGNPGKVLRPLKPEEIARLHDTANNYVRFAQTYVVDGIR